MEVKVTCCKDCPFYNDEWSNCKHPKHEFESGDCSEEWSKGISPKWCPLNTEPITIIKQ